jgi:hypothetical protein
MSFILGLLLRISGLAVGQYLQRITPSLDIGTECMYQKGGHIPGGQVAVMSMSARLKGKIIAVFVNN